MEYFLKVADYNWKPGSQEEMIYEDDKGKFFIGPPHSVVVGNSYVVEVSSTFPEDRDYHIIKFVG
jgi:hypothetical protein